MTSHRPPFATSGDAIEPTPAVQLIPMTAAHWPRVHEIFAVGIASGHATFAEAPPEDWAEFCTGKIPGLSAVARSAEQEVLGWCAASRVSTREVYAGVVEHSLYVDPTRRAQGIGKALLGHLIAQAEVNGIWMLQASIFPENAASLALHQRHGFRVVGVREGIGLMSHGPLAGHWRDTVLLERRLASPHALGQ
ncbi:N-acetyltransferase family protein [Glutamicibacter endophyticus]|uniref:GNAT family N-acetyltransferase n=1 Tax=Glutamicibacter endophyticus TaxID=1522174 RepID=UPI003AF1C553